MGVGHGTHDLTSILCDCTADLRERESTGSLSTGIVKNVKAVPRDKGRAEGRRNGKRAQGR